MSAFWFFSRRPPFYYSGQIYDEPTINELYFLLSNFSVLFFSFFSFYFLSPTSFKLCTMLCAPFCTNCLYFSSILKWLALMASPIVFFLASYSLISCVMYFSSSSWRYRHSSNLDSFYTFLKRRPLKSRQASKFSVGFFLGFMDLRSDPKPPFPPESP